MSETENPRVEGHLARRLTWAPVRVLAIITGFALLRGVLALLARFALVFRKRATATVEGDSVILEVKWSLVGKTIRETRTVSPVSSLEAVRFENRKRYVYLLVGFGFLAVGAWFGIQYLVDGLRAGYPYLALVGAGVVLAGVLLDILLYTLVPEGEGRSRIILAMGPWLHRIAGVDSGDGERFVAAARESWNSREQRGK